MKIFVIVAAVMAIFVAIAQSQAQASCPDEPPCAKSCCLSCQAAQSGEPQPSPPSKSTGPRCGCPACIVNPPK